MPTTAQQHAHSKPAGRAPSQAATTAERCFRLGRHYELEGSAAENIADAAYWYAQAAVRGHPGAQNALGFLYAIGRGVRRNDSAAVAWFRRAAEAGDADAQSNLGVMYVEGRGVASDPTEAVKWFQSAAQEGCPEAQQFLARAHREGRYGLPCDPQRAAYWRHNAVFARARRRHAQTSR